MEHVLLMTGIGGQGVQLASEVLARAAMREGLEVQLFGSYEGMMRGGATQTTLVAADGPVQAPPTAHRADAAAVLHHEHSAGPLGRVVPGGLVLVNTTVVEGAAVRPDCTVLGIPATELAQDAGQPMAAAMVMAGAFAAATGLAGPEALAEALAEALPPYRQAQVAVNLAALTAGRDQVGGRLCPWRAAS